MSKSRIIIGIICMMCPTLIHLNFIDDAFICAFDALSMSVKLCNFYHLNRSGNLVEGNPGATSGDETVSLLLVFIKLKKHFFNANDLAFHLQVSYHSLSWCKNWLGHRINITRAPQVPSRVTGVHGNLYFFEVLVHINPRLWFSSFILDWYS